MSQNMSDNNMDQHHFLLPQFPRELGVVLEEVDKDLVVASMVVTASHNNRNGVMHGGAIMALTDTLGGVAAAVNLAEGERTTTVESKTSFLRPIAIGETIKARCEPVKKGRKISIWQTTVYRQDGKACALTLQTQMTLTAEDLR